MSIEGRFEKLQFVSDVDLRAREYHAMANQIYRALMLFHVELFGLDVAMRLLFGREITKHNTKLKIDRTRHLWAVDASGSAISRWFTPGKFSGFCTSCLDPSCTEAGEPITKWGPGWARFECWAAEVSWLDAYEYKRRDVLTSMYFQLKEIGGYGSFQKRRFPVSEWGRDGWNGLERKLLAQNNTAPELKRDGFYDEFSYVSSNEWNELSRRLMERVNKNTFGRLSIAPDNELGNPEIVDPGLTMAEHETILYWRKNGFGNMLNFQRATEEERAELFKNQPWSTDNAYTLASRPGWFFVYKYACWWKFETL